jgi:hypothetical protein
MYASVDNHYDSGGSYSSCANVQRKISFLKIVDVQDWEISVEINVEVFPSSAPSQNFETCLWINICSSLFVIMFEVILMGTRRGISVSTESPAERHHLLCESNIAQTLQSSIVRLWKQNSVMSPSHKNNEDVYNCKIWRHLCDH